MPQIDKITEADVEIMKRAVAELNRHQHKYTVPVETEEREVTVVDVNHVVNYTGRFKTVVTRLRCESCPDEISREDK